MLENINLSEFRKFRDFLLVCGLQILSMIMQKNKSCASAPRRKLGYSAD